MQAGKIMKTNPEQIIHEAVSGMLPKNLLRKERLRSLTIYPGEEASEVVGPGTKPFMPMMR